jgi:hypothetical protein
MVHRTVHGLRFRAEGLGFRNQGSRPSGWKGLTTGRSLLGFCTHSRRGVTCARVQRVVSYCEPRRGGGGDNYPDRVSLHRRSNAVRARSTSKVVAPLERFEACLPGPQNAKVGVQKGAFGGNGYDCNCGCGAVRPSGVLTVSSGCQGELRETGQCTPHAASPGSGICSSIIEVLNFNDVRFHIKIVVVSFALTRLTRLLTLTSGGHQTRFFFPSFFIGGGLPFLPNPRRRLLLERSENEDPSSTPQAARTFLALIAPGDRHQNTRTSHGCPPDC